METEYFDSYAASRAAFLALAKTRSSRLSSHVLDGKRGVEGEELAVDVAIFGAPDARKALLIICGTHGLEGPPGSAAQRRFIAECGVIPDGVKIVAVHALNPWGFSHGSRTDDQNIDPNRNFIDFTAPLPVSRAYAQLHSAQCPEIWTDTASEELSRAIIEVVTREGLAFAMAGLTVGQYQEPSGLNFGGHGPCWSNRIFQRVAAEELGGCEKIAYVEWHSGLGDYAELFHVCLQPPGSEALDRASMWWGRQAVTRNGAAIQGTGGTAPNWQGLIMAALPQLLPEACIAGAVIEFGTFENTKVLGGLMIDRWLKFGGENRSSTSRAQLEQIKRDIFSPSDPTWRRLISERALAAQMKAFEGLRDW
jgi:hypothetical protein